MTENQGPTPEWMRKHAQQYEPPLVNQETNRRAYRKVSAFETLHKRGEIEYYQLRTAEALERHMYGAQGADVRIGDGGDESPRDMLAALHGPIMRQRSPMQKRSCCQRNGGRSLAWCLAP